MPWWDYDIATVKHENAAVVCFAMAKNAAISDAELCFRHSKILQQHFYQIPRAVM